MDDTSKTPWHEIHLNNLLRKISWCCSLSLVPPGVYLLLCPPEGDLASPLAKME